MYNIPTKKKFLFSSVRPKNYAVDFNALLASPNEQTDILFAKVYSSKGIPIKFKYEYGNT